MKNNKISLSSREASARDLRLSLRSLNQQAETKIRRCRITDFRHDRPFYVNSNNGFTLIELLVVVLIIGILAAVALPQYQKAVDKSRYSNLMAITKSIADANEIYYLANGLYATSFDELAIDIPATSFSENKEEAFFAWGRCLLIAQQEVQCANNTSLNNEYIIHYTHGTVSPGWVSCSAPNQPGSRYDKICQSFGTYYTNSSCKLGSCRIYRIYQR